ncbi:hypothetical protein JYK14_19205 [Siccirubricoccus sp. KC 17139]|uniref:Uncharacterized protein n=1 Tax=Siccirubricoccus soli TaxID=2899147 RepID=A0ABT1D8P3_9PROT|nr:hypothetical protein [Siccirubricoccus soli]MCO6418276.1 hypothetical protein [Siccirubricoccus soli]MCP2684411.1 hypothetical protein [Siccirubricoccus soli]
MVINLRASADGQCCQVTGLGLRAAFRLEGLPPDWQDRAMRPAAQAALSQWLAAYGVRGEPEPRPPEELRRLLEEAGG